MQIKKTITGVEPVLITEAKLWLKVDFSTDDALITSLITRVRNRIEEFTGLSLVASTIKAYSLIADLVDSEIQLPYPEHLSIESVKIDDVETTDFTEIGLTQKTVILSTSYGSIGTAVEIEYKTAGVCPDAVKEQILKSVEESYKNRGNTVGSTVVDLTENAYSNLMQFCII
jgi:hypothetical protein